MRLWILLLSLLLIPSMRSETPPGTDSELAGPMILKRPLPEETARPRIDRRTWTLLAAAGGARTLDAWSTVRMLKNNCSSGIPTLGTSTCNYEQNLPAFIANHPSGIYAFEGAAWVSEFTATRYLVRHHHLRLARFVPFIDLLSTTSFAVNNLTLSIGGDKSATSATSKSNHARHR